MVCSRAIIPLKDKHNLKMKFSKMKISVVPAQTLPDFLDPKIWDEIQKNKHGTFSQIISRY